MNVNEKILDKITGDAINIQRYEATVQRQVIQQLRDLEAQIVSELKASNVVTAVRKQTQDKRLTALLKKTRNTIAVAYKDIANTQLVILSEVAELSELQTVNALNKSIKANISSPVMSKSMLNAIASKTLIEGSPTKEWWARKGAGFQAKFEDTIRMGMLQGDTTDNIVRGLIGTKTNQFKDAALQAQRRGAEAVVRSSIQTVANTARLDTYANNADIIKGIEWSATFDNRTSVICMELDGLQWDLNYKPIGHSKPFPSAIAHWNCRSTQVPVTKSWEELGSKVKVEVPVGTRASMDGQVAGGQNYQQWLGTKSKAFQQEVLGVKKQQLWKAGKISFTDLVNQRGHPLTLEQLQNKIKPIPKPKPKPKPIPKPVVKPTSTKAVQEILAVQILKNSKSSKYVRNNDGISAYTRFNGAGTRKLGTVDLKGLTDDASVMFQGFFEEGSGWLNRFNIIGIRGIANTGRKRAIAMMGDGNFYFSKKFFNQYGATTDPDKLKKLYDEANAKTLVIKKQMQEAEKQYDVALKNYEISAEQLIASEIPSELIVAYRVAVNKYNKLITKYNKSVKTSAKENFTANLDAKQVSTWKVGDDLKNRPWSVKSYSAGGDQSMRSTTLHEFGHQIHQQFGVTNQFSYDFPPLESVLEKLFKARTVSPSKYADHNHKEWFAENFSLWARNKKELVDPRLNDLLRQMDKGTVKNKATLEKWFGELD